MNYDKFFGRFLKVEDVNGEMDLVVRQVQPEDVGLDEGARQKLVAHFVDLEKGLVLNKVNAEALAEAAGTKEIEQWAGVKVTLFVDPDVRFAGKKVGGIRVKAPPEDLDDLEDEEEEEEGD